MDRGEWLGNEGACIRTPCDGTWDLPCVECPRFRSKNAPVSENTVPPRVESKERGIVSANDLIERLAEIDHRLHCRNDEFCTPWNLELDGVKQRWRDRVLYNEWPLIATFFAEWLLHDGGASPLQMQKWRQDMMPDPARSAGGHGERI